MAMAIKKHSMKDISSVTITSLTFWGGGIPYVRNPFGILFRGQKLPVM